MTSISKRKAIRAARIALASYEVKSELKVEFGRRLVLAREAIGLSQVEAADAIGLESQVHLCRWEIGSRPVPLEMLPKLVNLYGVSYDFLFGETEDMDQDPRNGLTRFIVARVQSDLQKIAIRMADVTTTVADRVLPTANHLTHMAQLAVDIGRAMHRVEELNGGPEGLWQEIKGGTQLQAKIDLALDAANNHVRRMAFASKAMKTRLHPVQDADRPMQSEQFCFSPLDLLLDEPTK
jgi:transcriptional regulator with XRE-family HTH domain